ncbi:LOW QUALITY PROTEIN: 1-acyl-sn-glycerol-3-phosphate acyltransferase alpha-like [Harpia harpyja]|uniref:LOW QUALITY PROTEIN: 1-acyl-sn-glycerol-3-phosphate acyltransferase alpha-like n=1 Tax=Harpia harpyja TaxID=202280 RepID=UPI0022B0C4FC|nr:LOW QUALITY PROTEIN: 1-acyl-sn-glycerol-3-phosphate acyltransferase alpha-like [Harpia harpyja]
MELLLLHYPFTFLFIVFLVLYQVNPAFRHFCKMTFYKLWLFTLSILVIMISVSRGCNMENMEFLCMSFLPLNYIFGLKMGQGVKGKENLRTKKPFILMLNDQTSLDIMVMPEVLPNRCVPIAKKEILYMGTFGLVCWLSGLIFIDHKKREESTTTLIEVAHSLHKENFCVLIFPEGTCSHGSSMLPFKRGAFQLAVKAQVPIIPVVISSYCDFHNQKEKRFRPGNGRFQASLLSLPLDFSQLVQYLYKGTWKSSRHLEERHNPHPARSGNPWLGPRRCSQTH